MFRSVFPDLVANLRPRHVALRGAFVSFPEFHMAAEATFHAACADLQAEENGEQGLMRQKSCCFFCVACVEDRTSPRRPVVDLAPLFFLELFELDAAQNWLLPLCSFARCISAFTSCSACSFCVCNRSSRSCFAFSSVSVSGLKLFCLRFSLSLSYTCSGRVNNESNEEKLRLEGEKRLAAGVK